MAACIRAKDARTIANQLPWGVEIGNPTKMYIIPQKVQKRPLINYYFLFYFNFFILEKVLIAIKEKGFFWMFVLEDPSPVGKLCH